MKGNKALKRAMMIGSIIKKLDLDKPNNVDCVCDSKGMIRPSESGNSDSVNRSVTSKQTPIQ